MRPPHGHPQDHSLHQLQHVARSVETQLKLLRQQNLQGERELELASCFPDGKMIIQGHLINLQHTIDPEVLRGHVAQDGQNLGTLYINVRRGKCTAIDDLTHRLSHAASGR